MKWDVRILPFIIIFLLLSKEFFPQAGELDPTFGESGIVIGPAGKINSIKVQSDGKIIAAGTSYNGSDNDFAVVRYNTDGSLDNTFGTTGIIITPIGTSNDEAYSVAIQSDEKIVVTGYSNNGSDYDFAIIRYNTEGTLDNSFGTNGIVITPIGTANDYAYSAAIQSDEKIVVAGGYGGNFAIVRYNMDGTLDNTFGTNGIVTTQFFYPIGNASANSISIQSNGKMVVTGSAYEGSRTSFVTVRYNTDGILDNTFGTGGIVATGSDYFGNAVAIQSDEKIVVAGYSDCGSCTIQNKFQIVRYNTDGTLDNTFGTNGNVTTQVGDTTGHSRIRDKANSIVIQNNGKIIVAGNTYSDYSGSYFDFATVRYNPNGSLDNTFGTNGIVITPIGNPDDYANSMAIQSDGKIVVAGYSEYGVNNSDFAIVRYLNDEIVPVELISFEYSVNESNITLTWATATETNSYGFEIERAISDKKGTFDWSNIGFIPAHGTSPERNQYSFTDYKLNPGSYIYRLKMIDQDGSFEYSKVVNANISNPAQYSLSQNYPNPYNPLTVIKYQIPETRFVTLKVYDVLGNEVATIVEEEKPAGDYNVKFDASSLSGGVYFYRLQSGDFFETKKMILMK